MRGHKSREIHRAGNCGGRTARPSRASSIPGFPGESSPSLRRLDPRSFPVHSHLTYLVRGGFAKNRPADLDPVTCPDAPEGASEFSREPWSGHEDLAKPEGDRRLLAGYVSPISRDPGPPPHRRLERRRYKNSVLGKDL